MSSYSVLTSDMLPETANAASPLSRLKRDWIYYRKGIAAAAVVLILLQCLCKTVCPMRLLFGLPCPACGMTRAILAFLTGRWQEAWAWHPMFPGAVICAVLFVVTRYFRPSKFRIFKAAVIVFIAGMIVLYGYRMITQFPDHTPMLFYKDDILALKLLDILKKNQ